MPGQRHQRGVAGPTFREFGYRLVPKIVEAQACSVLGDEGEDGFLAGISISPPFRDCWRPL
jgi:hypothetical protein